MADDDTTFILELIRAANDIHRLDTPMRAELLRRVASGLRHYRYRISYDEAPANDDSSCDPAREWSEMARMADRYTDGELSQRLLDAADLIKVARAMLEEKQVIDRRLSE